MEVTELQIEGALVFKPDVHNDELGSSLESFRAEVYEEATGRILHLARTSISVSVAGTIRGVHYTQFPLSQAKYVTCVRGEILDVVVDTRVGSPTYGQWEAVSLDDRGHKAIYLSEGLGHAFMALEDDTVVSCLCSTPYSPEREHAVNPLDEELGIDWPSTDLDGRRLEPLLTPQDAQAPGLETARQAGLLPTMEEVQTRLEALRRGGDRQ